MQNTKDPDVGLQKVCDLNLIMKCLGSQLTTPPSQNEGPFEDLWLTEASHYDWCNYPVRIDITRFNSILRWNHSRCDFLPLSPGCFSPWL
jgi:hypothetical protein